jgi:hypothetical protein
MRGARQSEFWDIRVDALRIMWGAGVRASVIAAHFGCSRTPFSENSIVSAFSGACLARSACAVSAREGLLFDLPPDARANALRRLNACVLRS